MKITIWFSSMGLARVFVKLLAKKGIKATAIEDCGEGKVYIESLVYHLMRFALKYTLCFDTDYVEVDRSLVAGISAHVYLTVS
jgi:hypothetical protein